MSVKEQNQQHPPLPKKKRVDAQGNDRRRLFAKSGNATLQIAYGLTKEACDVLVQSIEQSIKNLDGICSCTWVKYK
jgi:hypothetical protein